MLQPTADQCAFAKARRSRDEGQFARQARIQSLHQVRARDEAGPEPGRRVRASPGDIEFGLQQGRVHTAEYTTLKSG
jgi:hypothetical protein